MNLPASDRIATPTERVLRIFTDVRPGEGRVCLLLLANVMLLLCAYYMVKPLREGWLAVSVVQGLSKMELKAYSGFGQSLVLLALMMLYGRLAARWPRRVLITRSTLFCMTTMVVFWALQPEFFLANLPGAGFAFYLWVGMFGVFIVAQFWSFAADLFDEDAGLRLIPLIAIGATSGAVVGSWLTEQLVSRGWIPSEYLLLAATLPLAIGLVLTHRTISLQPPGSAAGPSQEAAVPADVPGGIGIAFKSAPLVGIGLFTLLLSWINTNGENILFRVVQEVIESDLAQVGTGAEIQNQIRERTTLFYSDFFFWVNTVALVLQSFVASRLLRVGGFATLLLLAPTVALVSYSAMAAVAILPVIKAAKVAENALDYSLTNTARHVFWLPFPRHVTFRAKPTIDSLFARLGDGAAAATVLVGTHLLALGLWGYLWVNLLLIAGWFACSIWVVKRHREVEREAPL